jgi:plasmid maintenance system antidote protein VapI
MEKTTQEGIRDWLDEMEKFDNTAEGRGYDLRLDLADIILQHLAEKKWTQASLARAAGMKPSFLTRIIHGSQNFTADVAGRILFALGAKAKLMEIHEDAEEIAQRNDNGIEIIKKGTAVGSIKFRQQISISDGSRRFTEIG